MVSEERHVAFLGYIAPYTWGRCRVLAAQCQYTCELREYQPAPIMTSRLLLGWVGFCQVSPNIWARRFVWYTNSGFRIFDGLRRLCSVFIGYSTVFEPDLSKPALINPLLLNKWGRSYEFIHFLNLMFESTMNFLVLQVQCSSLHHGKIFKHVPLTEHGVSVSCRKIR